MTRIYVVTDDMLGGDEPKLVRAGNPAQAIRHVVGGRYKAEVAGQDKLVELIGNGAKVEDARDQEG